MLLHVLGLRIPPNPVDSRAGAPLMWIYVLSTCFRCNRICISDTQKDTLHMNRGHVAPCYFSLVVQVRGDRELHFMIILQIFNLHFG